MQTIRAEYSQIFFLGGGGVCVCVLTILNLCWFLQQCFISQKCLLTEKKRKKINGLYSWSFQYISCLFSYLVPSQLLTPLMILYTVFPNVVFR